MCAFFIQSFLDIFFPHELLEKKQINLRKGCRYNSINEQYDDDFDENDAVFLQEDDNDDDWRRKRRKRKRWSVIAVVLGEKNITNEKQKKDGCNKSSR